MNSLKNIVKRFIRPGSFVYRVIRKIYHMLSTMKYKMVHFSEEQKQKRYFSKQVENAVKLIKEKYQNADYIVLYNPTWLGVANSTKGLFENIVPLEQVFGKKNKNQVVNAILEANIKKVIFSQIVDGWTEVLKELKEQKPDIKIQVIWHANNYEALSDYTWELNKSVLRLYDNKMIDCFAFVKKSMVEFYNKVGYKAYSLMNNVNTEGIKKLEPKKLEKEHIKVGVYNANTRELKNIYDQLSSVRLIDGAKADIVPTNPAILQFIDIIGLENDSLPDYIPTKELLERIQGNDINLYITFTESSPMFPLESFEMGVPCLLGNNNDYFQNTKLGEYVIVSREDDPAYIKEKILNCLEHKEEIMKLYQEWKKEFDIVTKEYVKRFIEA